MPTALFTHADCHRHLMPPGHPESVARLAAVDAALAGFDLLRPDVPMGQGGDILRAHPQSHIDAITDALPDAGFAAIDGDTFLSPGSLDAALRGVGAICAAVDLVLAGGASNAFVATRPPGHHAEREQAMGFCLFGNAAIGALRALDHHGLARVAIIDFDVHHGNGTQDIVWNDPRICFASTHQMPLYPGTGAGAERGAHGQILNHPLAPGSGGAAMRAAYDDVILPAVARFAPELIVVSAGFDAHADDPLANLNWSTDDFRWLSGRICDIAEQCCNGRVVSTLEGGYDLAALGASVAAHVETLKERGA